MGYQDPQDLPPPPQGPSSPEEYSEESPPLPPPPQDDLMERRLQEEQMKLMQSVSATNNFLATDPRSGPRYSPTIPSMHQPSRPADLGGYQAGQDSSPNYQNLGFVSQVHAESGPEGQAPPPVPQPPDDYETYDKMQQPPPPTQKTQRPRDRSEGQGSSQGSSRSAWDRDAKEKAEEEEQEELYRAREAEIVTLSQRTALNPQDQDRLRKLKTAQEFDRRVREIAERGDYDYEDDDELTERIFTRERLIQTLKEDLDKSRARARDLEVSQRRADADREVERMQGLERRLEMYERDREEQRQRMARKTEKMAVKHQEQQRQQRESRERQRQNYEDQKRQLMKEEEKLNQRRDEEMTKRRQFEHQRRLELAEQREVEERRARQEARAMEEARGQAQREAERQLRAEQQRPVKVADQRRKLDAQAPYSQYANLAALPDPAVPQPLDAPPPPQRGSSYDSFSQHQQRNSFRGSSSENFPPPPSAAALNASLPSALKNWQEPKEAKKSVSFNTQMNTYKERTPQQSVSSYKSPEGSQSSETGGMMDPHTMDPPAPLTPGDSDVFDPSTLPSPPPPHEASSPSSNGPQAPQAYNSTKTTPNVIGAQEVYRDPRSRIAAQRASAAAPLRASPGKDRLSFSEKMKFFAAEAGDEDVKNKPRASRTLRTIESKLGS